METMTQPKITGYRQLSEEDAARMNEIKRVAEQVGALVDVMSLWRDLGHADGRWLAIGTTELQQGFMALTRAVARPESF